MQCHHFSNSKQSGDPRPLRAFGPHALTLSQTEPGLLQIAKLNSPLPFPLSLP